MNILIRSLTTAALVTATASTACAHAQAPLPPQASPTLTWNQIALDSVVRAKPTQHQAARLLAYLSLAQYAVLAETQDKSAAPDAVATASMRVIAGLAPSQAAFAGQRLRESGARETGHGRRVAQHVLAQAHSDEFIRKTAAQTVVGAYSWRSLANPPAPPAYPDIGAARTFLLESGSGIRSAPPPDVGSRRFQRDVAEVQRLTAAPTPDTERIARFYDMTTGTLAAGFWNEQAVALIRRDKLAERQAARVLATMNTAIMDALIACHDTKYAYWVPRPSQADASIKPLIGVPNHPSYPSNHSCLSTAAATVLAHFFAPERSRLQQIASEAGVSRIYAGLHYRFDVDAGEDIGRKVAHVAVTRHPDMLARWTQTLLALGSQP